MADIKTVGSVSGRRDGIAAEKKLSDLIRMWKSWERTEGSRAPLHLMSGGACSSDKCDGINGPRAFTTKERMTLTSRRFEPIHPTTPTDAFTAACSLLLQLLANFDTLPFCSQLLPRSQTLRVCFLPSPANLSHRQLDIYIRTLRSICRIA